MSAPQKTWLFGDLLIGTKFKVIGGVVTYVKIKEIREDNTIYNSVGLSHTENGYHCSIDNTQKVEVTEMPTVYFDTLKEGSQFKTKRSI